ncbi:hypothetical protein [Streptomyces sp. NBC_01361]|uniref:hypothetical protein n=1 Tax=Streptomyces sp. NBC_01361 TaxID=2903838 RepID=UPI002E31850C|nr:hypothetical protein [Streptomyces sp. NBC_01361]
MRTARAESRRWAAAGAVVVNCKDNRGALQPAIAGAAPGATLMVKGTCTGPFTITKDLTLIGQGRAVLDGNQAGSTVTVTGAVQVRLTTLTIINGIASAGGGINNAGGTVTLDDSTVRNNEPDNCFPPGSVPGCTG